MVANSLKKKIFKKKPPRAVRMGKSNQAGKTLTHTEDHLNFVTKVLFCKCYRID